MIDLKKNSLVNSGILLTFTTKGDVLIVLLNKSSKGSLIFLRPVLWAAATWCHCGPSVISYLFVPPSFSNKKQMGDFPCGLLPNGANSHYSVCKLCLFSSSFTSTLCTSLPSDVFNTCFQCRYVILICFVVLITGYLSYFGLNGKQTSDLSVP